MFKIFTMIFFVITILILLDNFYFHFLEHVFGIPHKNWR